MHRKYAGYIAVIISGIVYGCMPLLAKIVFSNGGNPINLAFWRFFISIFPLYIILRRNKNVSLRLTKMEIKQIILLGILGYAGTTVTIFLSYNYINSGMATTIHFVYPVFVILGYSFFYKEKLNLVKFISVILCTAGIVLLYDGSESVSIVGVLLAFISGLTYAFYVLYIDKSGLTTMNPIKLTFYLSIVGSIVMFFFSLGTKQFTLGLNPVGWLFTVILAVVIAFGAVSLLNVGIKLVGPQSASILSTLEPITSVVIGALVFDEVLGMRGILACGLILLAVVIIAIYDIREAKEEKIHIENLTS